MRFTCVYLAIFYRGWKQICGQAWRTYNSVCKHNVFRFQSARLYLSIGLVSQVLQATQSPPLSYRPSSLGPGVL